METNTTEQQSAERQSDALAVLLSADELASYAEAQRVCEAFPNDTTSGTGILTCDLARLLIVIDRLAASAIAAPDLLAACKSWVAYFDRLCRDDEPGDPLAAARNHFH